MINRVIMLISLHNKLLKEKNLKVNIFKVGLCEKKGPAIPSADGTARLNIMKCQKGVTCPGTEAKPLCFSRTFWRPTETRITRNGTRAISPYGHQWRSLCIRKQLVCVDIFTKFKIELVFKSCSVFTPMRTIYKEKKRNLLNNTVSELNTHI